MSSLTATSAQYYRCRCSLETLVPNYASQAVTAILELAKPEIRALVEAEFGVVLGGLLGELIASFVDDGI